MHHFLVAWEQPMANALWAVLKVSDFIVMCVSTLFNTFGNVTGHHGKHFAVSRQTLWLMAKNPHAFLLTLPGPNFLACGGIVVLPSTSSARARGMIFMIWTSFFLTLSRSIADLFLPLILIFYYVMISFSIIVLIFNTSIDIYVDCFVCCSWMQKTMALSCVHFVSKWKEWNKLSSSFVSSWGKFITAVH